MLISFSASGYEAVRTTEVEPHQVFQNWNSISVSLVVMLSVLPNLHTGNATDMINLQNYGKKCALLLFS